MKTKLKYFIIIISVLSSCSEDFLVQPPLNAPTSGNYWHNEDEVIMAANSLYQTFRMDYAYNVGHVLFSDLIADDMTIGGAHESFLPLDDFNFNSSNIKIAGSNDSYGYWGVWFNAVFRANWILNNVYDVKNISNEIKVRTINEAHFFRGVAYFNLAISFGDVPLFTKLIGPEESKTVLRIPVAEVWEQIEKDLLKAAGLDENLDPSGIPLPVKDEYELGRVTKGAAYAFLARVFLYQDKFEKAELMAKKVIDLGTYELNPDFGANWDNHLENGKESIYEIQYKSGQTGYDWGMWPGNQINGNTANSAFAPGGNGWNNFIASPHVDTLFEKNSLGKEDLRRKYTIFRIGDTYEFNPNHPYYLSNDKHANGYTISKYVVRNDILSVNQDINRMLDADNNIPVIRYAEVLLIYAESLYRNGKTSDAFTQLNKIRERAGLDDLDGTEDFMEKLIHERRIELAFEGHRFHDLKRWGMLEEVLGSYGYRPITKGLLPIPQTDRDLNPNLRQNEGYN